MNMKTTYRYLAAAFAAIAAVSCAKPELEGPEQGNTPEGTYEYVLNVSQEDTKTTMDGLSILWSEGDLIAVLCKDENGIFVSASPTGEQAIADGIGTTKATFNLSIPDGYTPVAAVYPYNSANSLEDKNRKQEPTGEAPLEEPFAARFYIPADQIGVMNDFPVEKDGDDTRCAFPMVGSIKDGECVMHNAGALIKFEITRSDITSLKFEGNDSEPISGRSYYYIDDAVFKRSTGYSAYSVTLRPSGKVFEPGVYYFALAPQNLENGFTMTLTNNAGIQTVRSTSTPFEIKRNTVYTNFGSDSWFKVIVTGAAGNLGTEDGTTATLHAIAPQVIDEGATYGFQTSSDGETWTDFEGAITENFQEELKDEGNVYTASLTGIVPATPTFYRAVYRTGSGCNAYGKTYSFKTYANATSVAIDMYGGWCEWPFQNIEYNGDNVQTENNGINKGTGTQALWKGVPCELTVADGLSFEVKAVAGIWVGRSGCLTMKVAIGDYLKFPVIAGKKPVSVTLVSQRLANDTNPSDTDNNMGKPSIRKIDATEDALGGNVAPAPTHAHHIHTWALANTDESQYEMYFNSTWEKGLNLYLSYLEVVYVDSDQTDQMPAAFTQTIEFADEDANALSWPLSPKQPSWEDYKNSTNNLIGPFTSSEYPTIEYKFFVQTITSNNNWRTTGGQGLRFGGTIGDYMQLCPVEDYKITKIYIRGGNGKVIATYSVTDANGSVVVGGEAYKMENTNNHEKTFTLTGTSANTEYRLMLNSTGQAAIREIGISYERVE